MMNTVRAPLAYFFFGLRPFFNVPLNFRAFLMSAFVQRRMDFLPTAIDFAVEIWPLFIQS